MPKGEVSIVARWLAGLLPLLALALAKPARGDDPTVQAAPLELPPAADVRVDFARDIQPIFAAKCLSCHGPRKQESAYRLDHRDTALRGGDIGKAVIPGKSAESPLIRYVAGLDDGIRMPPDGELLLAQQIGLLRAWIDQGTVWPDVASVQLARAQDHWAFRPPVRSALSNVQRPGWVRMPLDTFILARLEKEGLSPSAEADRVTLLRRLSLDLTGLPPTPEEIDSLLADDSPRAYERQVDRLLASPHYGERWGRHWLDVARYADSDGYEKDKPRSVWLYRDWVVSALNHDLPYRQFIIEQIAGDMLPGATQDQVLATGFLRNSMINEEGGVDPEQFRMDAMFDRMDAIGKGILGLTIQCGQCHNHKYDPLTQEEYYRMFAYVNDAHEASVAAYAPDDLMKAELVRRQIAEVEEELRHRSPDWPERMAAWEESVRGNQPQWEVLPARNAGDNSQRYVYHDDGSATACGYAPTKWSSSFRATSQLPKITAIRLEMLRDPNLPLGGPGRSPIGLFALTELGVEFQDVENPASKVKGKFVSATADFGNAEQPLEAMFHDKTDRKRVTGPVSMAIDGNDDTAWGVDAGPGRRNVERTAVFVLEQAVEFPRGAVLTFQIKQNHGGWNSDDNQNNNLGRFRFSVTGAPAPVADAVPKRVRDVLSISPAARSPAQTAAVFSYWRTTVPAWQEANDRIEQLWREHPVGASQLSLMARDEPRPTFMLKRGDFLKPGKAVSPGVPAFLNPLPPDAVPSRLTFAEWLVDRRSPTTARTIVNRVWQAHFGQGLVSTSEDLGLQSDQPSHPELLDWLAVEFMDSGWSFKHLHRQIVLSSTYRQSSRVTAEALARDPENRLLARAPRLRVEGEVVRDIALAASGLLNPALGGASVHPPAPDFLFLPPASYGPKVWVEDRGAGRYRRGLYTFRYRSVPYPMLTNFDTPNGDTSCVRRARSNTPLQALTTLNEPLFVESARALALRALREGGSGDAERLVFVFRRCVARQPADQEAHVLLQLLSQQQQRFSAPDAQPWEWAANDPEHPPQLPTGVTPAQCAAWTTIARVVLNLDETITKE